MREPAKKTAVGAIDNCCLALTLREYTALTLSLSGVDESKQDRPPSHVAFRCNHDGIASLLFTVRSSEVSTHKGQVCLCARDIRRRCKPH